MIEILKISQFKISVQETKHILYGLKLLISQKIQSNPAQDRTEGCVIVGAARI